MYIVPWHIPTSQCILTTFNYYLQHATHTKTVRVVAAEDGQVMAETCRGFEF
jgi:hypothetical protein